LSRPFKVRDGRIYPPRPPLNAAGIMERDCSEVIQTARTGLDSYSLALAHHVVEVLREPSSSNGQIPSKAKTCANGIGRHKPQSIIGGIGGSDRVSEV
jgi:hypothetical protein